MPRKHRDKLHPPSKRDRCRLGRENPSNRASASPTTNTYSLGWSCSSRFYRNWISLEAWQPGPQLRIGWARLRTCRGTPPSRRNTNGPDRRWIWLRRFSPSCRRPGLGPRRAASSSRIHRRHAMTTFRDDGRAMSHDMRAAAETHHQEEQGAKQKEVEKRLHGLSLQQSSCRRHTDRRAHGLLGSVGFMGAGICLDDMPPIDIIAIGIRPRCGPINWSACFCWSGDSAL